MSMGMRFVLVVTTICATLLAMFVPKPAAAVNYTVDVQLWPGGGSTLTCGWHSGPCWDDDSLVSSGLALDWSSNNAVNFYTKTSTNSPMFPVAGSAYITVPTQSSCSHHIYAEWYDNNALLRNRTHYIHTSNTISDGTSFYINTSQYGFVDTTRALGTTANESGCTAWTGYHLHQQMISNWTIANYPDHSTCNQPNITDDCWVANSYYMGYASWQVPY